MKLRQLRTFFVLIAVASPLLGADLVTNSSFNGSLSGWVVDSGTTYDPTLDATGTPGSGSARSVVAVVGYTPAVSQCIAAVPGIYTLSGKVLVPAQPTVGSAEIDVTWFGGPNCSGLDLGGIGLNSTATTGSFISLSTLGTAPPGTVSALVSGQNVSNSGATHIANFDDIVLDGPPSTNVPALGPFERIALMLMLAALGAWILRRH
jgi:hypothetical protein